MSNPYEDELFDVEQDQTLKKQMPIPKRYSKSSAFLNGEKVQKQQVKSKLSNQVSASIQIDEKLESKRKRQSLRQMQTKGKSVDKIKKQKRNKKIIILQNQQVNDSYHDKISHDHQSHKLAKNKFISENKTKQKEQAKHEQGPDILDNQKLTLNIENTTEVQKVNYYFHLTPEQLQKLSVDKINRLNNKIRDQIFRLNQQIDHMIQRAIIKAKLSNQNSKRGQKALKNNRLEIFLNECVNNNKITLQSYDKEYNKLVSIQGALKEQHYQFLIEKQKDNIMAIIKEQKILIAKLKKSEKINSNKIVESQLKESKKNASLLNSLKEQFIIIKRESDRNQILIRQLDDKIENKSRKNQHLDERMALLLQNAREQNIQIVPLKEGQTIEKLKKKLQNLKQLKNSSQRAYSKQIVKINNQVKILIAEIKNIDGDLNQAKQKMEMIEEKVLKVINKRDHIGSKSPPSQIPSSLSPSHKNTLSSRIHKSKMIDQVRLRKQKNVKSGQRLIKQLQPLQEQENENEFLSIKPNDSNNPEIENLNNRSQNIQNTQKILPIVSTKDNQHLSLNAINTKNPSFPSKFTIKKINRNQ